MKRAVAILLPTVTMVIISLVFALATTTEASQNTLFSPTTGTVSGLQLTNNYNGAIDSVNTCNSGSVAPTNQLTGIPSLGNCWLNTTSSPYPRQYYDGANWLTPFWLDATNHYTDVKIGGGVATVASAATVDLCGSGNAPQAYIMVSGTTMITSFGSTCNAGHVKFVTFLGTLTLTYNATSLILPGAASITTAAGDQAIVVSLGSGNWQVVNYTPASGQALVNPAVPVGTVLTYSGATIPANFLEGYGETISRVIYPNYLAAVTSTQSVTRTSGSSTVTGLTDTTRFGYGQHVEGTGIPTGSTILSCTPTTCTLSNNASSSGTANLVVFFYGDGDGSTTVNLPDCRGKDVAYRDNMGGSASNILQVTTTITTSSGSSSITPASLTGIAAGMYIVSANVPPGTYVALINASSGAVTMSASATASASGTGARFSPLVDAQALGATGGNFNHALTSLELPVVTPTGSIGGSYPIGEIILAAGAPNAANISVGGASYTYYAGAGLSIPGSSFSFTGSAFGGNSAHLIQNPTIVMTCIVRVSRLLPPRLPSPSNDNRIAEEIRRAA